MDHASRTDLYEPQILCVDADIEAQAWMRDVLRRCRIASHVRTVATGRQAFNLLVRDQFDLCILDYALPDMSGVQLCSLLRHMGHTVPMMLFTAMNRPVDRRRASECGIAEFLAKPDDIGGFHVAVRRILSRTNPREYVQDANVLSFPRAA